MIPSIVASWRLYLLMADCAKINYNITWCLWLDEGKQHVHFRSHTDKRVPSFAMENSRRNKRMINPLPELNRKPIYDMMLFAATSVKFGIGFKSNNDYFNIFMVFLASYFGTNMIKLADPIHNTKNTSAPYTHTPHLPYPLPVIAFKRGHPKINTHLAIQPGGHILWS